DSVLQEGQDFPVVRLLSPVPLTTGPAAPLPEDRVADKPITIADLDGPQPPNLFGSPIREVTWLEDGKHYLQVKDGKLCRVEAVTGQTEPFFNSEKLAEGLAALPAIGAKAAANLARATNLRMNPERTAALFDHQSDLYYCKLDGTGAVRLTKTPGAK